MFRQKVIDAQKQRLYGEISLAQPLSIYVVASFVLFSFLLLLIFLITSNYARKETVKGYLVPNTGVIKVYPTQTGTLDTLYVNDGDAVTKGDVIAKVVLNRTQLDGIDLSENVIEALNKQDEFLAWDLKETIELSKKELIGLSQKRTDLELSIESAEKQIKLLTQQYNIKHKEYARYKKLHQNQFISNVDLQAKKSELITIQESIEVSNTDRLSLVYQLNDVRYQLSTKPHNLKLRTTEIQRQQTDIKRQLDEVKNNYTFTLVAKESGIVTAILFKEGELLVSNRPLLSIIPEGAELVAELLFPTRSAGFVKVNDVARLRFDAFPYQRFGFIDSRVQRIDKSLLSAGEVELPISLSEPVYRVQTKLSQQSITAYGELFPLKTGMLLEADIILENRTLIEWLLDPIYSLRGRVG